MCPPTPKVTTTVTPPPTEVPQPLASPYGEDEPLGLSQLRFGSKNNLRLRGKTQSGSGGASAGASSSAPSAPSAGSGGGSGGSRGGGGSTSPRLRLM